MTDVTLLVVAANVPGPADPDKWRRGEIVEIFEMSSGRPSSAFVNIHITGIPKTLEQIRNKVMRRHWADDEEEGEEPVALARRRWVIDHTIIPAGKLQELQDNGHFTVTWAQVKAFIKRRNLNLMDLGDAIEDGDIT